MEPWDGPASIAFTDGTVIGAVLDRNGLRPSRYYVTKDDLVIMASEVGVLDIPPENIVRQGAAAAGPHVPRRHRAGPHRRRRGDQARARARAARTREWLNDNLVDIDDLPAAPYLPPPDHETVLRRQQAFGYTHEDLRILLAPMATNGEEPIGSMGTDTPLAVLSDRPRLLYDYFKQLFAQVTNPPLDAIREELVTSMESTIGPEGNLLEPRPGVVPADRDQVPDHRQRAAGEAAPRRRARLPVDRRCRCCSTPAQGGAGLERGARRRCSARASEAVDAGLHDPDPVRPRRRSRAARRSRACSRRPACTITWSAKARARAARWSSRSGDAREVHHSRCCSATAPARSTRTSRSRRSTT